MVRRGTQVARNRLITALVVCGALTFAVPAAGGSCGLFGCPPGPGGSPEPAAVRAFVGVVSTDVLTWDYAQQSATLQRMAAVGIGTIRVPFVWSLIEPRRGRYHTGLYDQLVLNAAVHGITIMPILFDTPAFRSSRPRRHAHRGFYPPRRPADITTFARVLVSRYGPRGELWREHPEVTRIPLRVWQVWNEPNLPVYWPAGPNARQYLRLLRAAARGVKSVDPGATVITAGLASSKYGGSLSGYLTRLYQAGGSHVIGGVAVNAYPRNNSEMEAMLSSVRRVMYRFGARGKQIYVAEFGWADTGPDRTSPHVVGPAGQAAKIDSAITGLWDMRRRLGIAGFTYYEWRDSRIPVGGHDFWGLYTGLVTLGGQDKPALQSFAQAVAGLASRGS